MEVQRPRGTRDFLPEEMAKRRFVEKKMRDVAQSWGYGEIKTPTFENLELFTIKSGEGILGEIYNFKDKGDREIALRPELTAPVIRMYVEELQRSAKPLKFYYFDNCFRYERPQKGRFREFFQFGVEIIGSARPEAEAEVIAMAVEMLKCAGVQGHLHVGNLYILRTLLKDLEAEYQSKIMRFVDKKDDKGLEDFLDNIQAPNEIRDKLFRLKGLFGENAVHEARELLGDIEAISQFETLLKILDVYGLEYKVDLGIARGLDYYTGMVFEIYCKELGAQDQVCGGGSYRLAQLFGGEDTPSTGYAIGFDRIMEVCQVEYQPQIRVAVICFDDTRKEAIKIAKKLRDEGFNTYLDLMGRKFKDQLTYINTLDNSRYEQIIKLYGGIENNELDRTHAIIVGTDELKAGKYTFKDMARREQSLMMDSEIIDKLKRLQL